MFRRALLTAMLASAPLCASAGGTTELNVGEQRLAGAIEARFDAALALLRESVEINSGTMNLDGVEQVGRLFATEFEALGFNVRWSDQRAIGRAGHLVATRDAAVDKPITIVLIGHLDTVFEPDSPFQRFQFVTEDGEVSAAPTRWGKGPGTTDMKGGNVIMLEVLRALDAVGTLDHFDVRAVLIGDEERSGRPHSISRRDLREAAQGADFALGFEDGDGNPETAVISRRGASGWTLRVEGTPAHSSQIFQDRYGAGAIFEAARILDAFYRELSSVPNLTFNPGTILGGTEVDFDTGAARGTAFGKNNVIAETALVHGDLRALSPEQYEQAKERMRGLVAEHRPGTKATIEFTDGYPPMAPTDGNRELLSMLDQASRDLGLGSVAAVNPRNAGAADISFVADLVPRAMDGLGLMGDGGHTIHETADLETLVTQAQRVALLLYRLTRR